MGVFEIAKIASAGGREAPVNGHIQLPDGLTWDTVISAVGIILEWESGQFYSDMATDLVISLYTVLRK